MVTQAGPRALARFARQPAAMAGALTLTILIALAAAAPLVAAALGVDGQAIDLFRRFAGPEPGHPLGTDGLGRDVLVRLLYGARVSLAVGLVAALASAGFGTVIGLAAGYCGGRIDAVLMRFTDAVISLPLLPLLIVLTAVDPAKLGLPAALAGSEAASFYRIVPVIAVVGWTTAARLVRGAALAARAETYVRAAEALGASPLRVMVRHILPNVASPLVVATTLSIGNIILLESVLSFLGLGIQPPMPSWGNMLNNAQELIWSAPLQAVWPGLLIFVTVIAFNLVGDGLQEALDPRAGGRH